MTAQSQAPIVTVTLNPALDLSTATDRVVPDLKLRCDAPHRDPGGGGINVSRAIAELGGTSTAMVALGGNNGRRVAEMLAAAGIDTFAMQVPGETRASLAVTDRMSGRQFRFVMPGPAWDAGLVEQVLGLVEDRATSGGLVVLSGSFPPGVPVEFVGDLAQRVGARGAGLVVDTSGGALRVLAESRHDIALLRMDAAEAEGLAGRSLLTRRDSASFAGELVSAGVARAVIVARGADGNVIAGKEGAWHAEAAQVEVVSRVGAGDSFVAAFTLSLARGWSLPDALGLGSAAASAACMTPATELCRRADVEALFEKRVVTRL